MATHILLTGASRGIGRAAAARLAGEDVRLVGHASHAADEVDIAADLDEPGAADRLWTQALERLGVVLAHADLVAEDRGERPVLLLDEVAAHLDARRRAALFARLEAAGGQVWMTGTEAAPFAGIAPGATWLHVTDGQVLPG